MKQHPIPQNVTQYQFRLVGNMTLKQFLELAGGIILAYLTYASNLLIIIKLPLSLMFALAGIGMAFFPLEERPLDQWLINFIKAIYSPTLYYWKKEPQLPTIFAPTPKSPTINQPQSPPKPNSINALAELESTTTSSPDTNDPDLSLLQKINQLFSQFPQTPPTSPTQSLTNLNRPPRKPSIRIRKLKFSSPPPTTTPTPPNHPPRQKTTTIFTQQSSPSSTTPTNPAPTNQTTPTTIFRQPSPLPTEKINHPIPAETVDITPLTPTKPGLVAGLVTDANNKILPNLIVEIVDQNGLPQRAVKTDALGQFSISTPLPQGKYFVKVDDEHLQIPPQTITINNQITPPIHLHPAVN